jgi:hypothetical protein
LLDNNTLLLGTFTVSEDNIIYLFSILFPYVSFRSGLGFLEKLEKPLQHLIEPEEVETDQGQVHAETDVADDHG